MGAGHAHPLYRPGDSAVHRLPPEVKIIAAAVGVVAIVATPRAAFGVFASYGVLLAGIWLLAGIPFGWMLRRSLIETPFVALAVLLPFAGDGPRIVWLGMSLSEPGLYGAWNILVKGTLGVLTSLTLAGTTPLRDLLLGLQRLRAPNMVLTIATLMLRYVDVITGEAHRMRLARISRGHDPRFLWQVGATARGIGALFVRSYERGERVHLAMLSRGWTAAMPQLGERHTTGRQWLAGLAPAALATGLALTGWMLV
ncbi:MAG: cobalt ECF transporter T component CbiQ [Pseudonocardia sp.]|nr:cobalt ECF transporter T component CbiQ [Pseudonocardia sp.]